jgi:hypothetical protein
MEPDTPKVGCDKAQSFWRTHNLFIKRCSHVLDGLFQFENTYCHDLFQDWLHQHEKSVGREGIAGLVFRLLRFEFVELLCADTPPTAKQLKALCEDETENFMAVYLLLVSAGGSVYHYSGSATQQARGFRGRQSNYINRTIEVMPQFIETLIADKKKFKILCMLPILRVFPHEGDDIVFGDLRVPILLIETLIMIWFRTLKKGSKYERLMAYSPWSADEISFVRSNRVPSTRSEWPMGIDRTPEQVKELTEKKRKRSLESTKKYNATSKGKACMKEYKASAKGTAKGKVYRKKHDSDPIVNAKNFQRERKYRASAKGEAAAKKRASDPVVKAKKLQNMRKYKAGAKGKATTERRANDPVIKAKRAQKARESRARQKAIKDAMKKTSSEGQR